MRVAGHERIFRVSPTSQSNRDTVIIGSRKVANQGSFKLTEKFVRLLLFSALITFCYGVISMPLSSKLFSRVFFHSNSGVHLTNDLKQRNNLGISSEVVGIENEGVSEQKHLRAEKVKTIKMVMAAAAAAADVLVKIQQNQEQIWREAKEALKIMPEKRQRDTPKEEGEVLQGKEQKENSKELPHTDVRNAVKTVTQRPEFHQKGEKNKKIQENIVHREEYTVVKSNVMDFCTSSNAMTQDNSEGFMEKNATHIQRKNYRSGNTEEKQLLEHLG